MSIQHAAGKAKNKVSVIAGLKKLGDNLRMHYFDSIYGSIPYRKMLWETLESLDLHPKMKMLDAGCGIGMFELFVKEKGIDDIKIEAIDSSAANLKIARSRCQGIDNLNFRHADLNGKLLYTDNYFDRIICINVIHGVNNRLYVLRELYRILKPGGKLVVVDSEPESNLFPILKEQFTRIKNIKGFSRRIRAFLYSFIRTPLMTLDFLWMRVFKGKVSSKYQERAKYMKITKNNNFDGLETRPVYAAQDWLLSASKIAEEDKIVSRPLDVLESHTDSMLLYPNGIEPIKPDECFEMLDVMRLDGDSDVMNELVDVYRRVFGAPDVWGEGAYCSLDVEHIISLPEFENRRNANDIACDCGGVFHEYHPHKEVKDRILSQLTTSAGEKPFCAIMRGPVGGIAGFVWGAVVTVGTCINRVREARHKHVSEEEWEFEIERLTAALRDEDLDLDDQLLLVDELGVLAESRVGLGPLLTLSSFCFKHAFANECQKILFWTSPSSPLFKMSRLFGFNQLLITPHDFAFLFCHDTIPGLKIFQNKEPNDILPVFLASARKFKSIMKEDSL